MLTEKEILAQEEHFRNLRREAQNAQLARAARHGQTPRNVHVFRALAWLGRQMIALGAWLTARYAAVPAASAFRPAEEP
jgi:hypothetical protein